MTSQYEPYPIINTNNHPVSANEGKPVSPSASQTSPWRSHVITVIRDISANENDPLTGTGLFAHNATNDIPYELLLTRLSLQKDCSIKLNTYTSEKRKLLKPYVIAETNKRTIIANFDEICDGIGRDREHLVQYLFAELGTSGSFDQRGRLIMKGRFQTRSLGFALDRYSKIYLICSNCGSNKTDLRKLKHRSGLMTCNDCDVEALVPAIRTGFVNMIPRRKKPIAPPEEEPTPEPPDEPAVYSAPGEHCFTGFRPRPKL
ncbi:translation initiation factor IF2/IF5 [Lophiostoma macrostomum CBS 122681]|uniref:Translation initiation factor IF2/IF5 n=1 Tax=Lophiostoma macrostomum CBS 122681 TaxID=1314788 RepID=A0A6A6SLJ4_9PLEO|nr:translation initiation factor IF2/IF5 [Lophiostoma macrostomum CBS 122681]